MVTVPILGTDLHPRERSPSLFHTFELSGTGGKILHSICVSIRVQIRPGEISHYSGSSSALGPVPV